MSIGRLAVYLCAVILGGVACTAGDGRSGPDGDARPQPPVRLFTAWLEAFNSGDPKRYARFVKRAFPFRGSVLRDDLELRKLTGGFDLRALTHVTGTQVLGRMQARTGGQLAEFELTLELYLQGGIMSDKPVAARPYRIVHLDLRLPALSS